MYSFYPQVPFNDGVGVRTTAILLSNVPYNENDGVDPRTTATALSFKNEKINNVDLLVLERKSLPPPPTQQQEPQHDGKLDQLSHRPTQGFHEGSHHPGLTPKRDLAGRLYRLHIPFEVHATRASLRIHIAA